MHVQVNASKRCVNFSCEGEVKLMETKPTKVGTRYKPSARYGISKEEDRVADYYGVHGLRDTVGV